MMDMKFQKSSNFYASVLHTIAEKERDNMPLKTKTPEELKLMPIAQIGFYIIDQWHNISYSAKPYAIALCFIDEHGMYGADSVQSIAMYFLANAQCWRGDAARAVKAELKSRYYHCHK
jgi:hypothetical protein